MKEALLALVIVVLLILGAFLIVIGLTAGFEYFEHRRIRRRFMKRLHQAEKRLSERAD